MDSISLLVCQVDPAKMPPGTLSTVGDPDALVALVTWIPREEIMRIGLPRGAVCGMLHDASGGIAP